MLFSTNCHKIIKIINGKTARGSFEMQIKKYFPRIIRNAFINNHKRKNRKIKREKFVGKLFIKTFPHNYHKHKLTIKNMLINNENIVGIF